MKVAGNIIAVTGLTVFILAGCSLDSTEPYGTTALLVALAGLITTYLGYRLEEIGEFLNRICKRLEKIVRLKQKQRRKHRKVARWLDRAQRNI